MPFPIAFVLIGPDAQPVARAIVHPQSLCPSLVADGVDLPVLVRAEPFASGPYTFPVRTCEAMLPKNYVTAHFGSRLLPRTPTNPQTYILIGDTGMRVKVKNDGTCATTADTEVFGVPQCAEFGEFDESQFHASIQGLGQSLDPNENQWPYQTIANVASSHQPDIVVHVGDYLYRQSPCPVYCPGHTECPCTGMGDNWGDNWQGWYSDFFEPSSQLLSAAPWIALRGNHEDCKRAGHGYFRFLDPRPLPKGELDYCVDFTPPFAIPFEKEQWIVMDTNMLHPVKGGIDHYDCMCPDTVEPGTAAHGLPRSDARYAAELAEYRRQFDSIISLLDVRTPAILATHRPIYALACDEGAFIAMDDTLQRAVAASGLLNTTRGAGPPAIRLILSGHMHWFQYVAYHDEHLPAQLVVGHGSTQLLPRAMPTAFLHNLEVSGAKVLDAKSMREFGFARMWSANGKFHIHEISGTNVTRHHVQIARMPLVSSFPIGSLATACIVFMILGSLSTAVTCTAFQLYKARQESRMAQML